MVELFAVLVFTRTPELLIPVIVVTNNELPTPARLNEPIKAPSPLGGIIISPAWILHGLV